MKRIKILYIVPFLLLNCTTKKQVQKQMPDKESITSICAKIKTQQPEFITLNASKITASVNFGGQTKHLFVGIQMLNDSFIYVSLQPLLGMEMFRIEFTPEKIRAIDKMKRRYAEFNYDFLRYKHKLPIDFHVLQEILSAHLFVIGRKIEENNCAEIFTQQINNQKNILASTSSDGTISQNITLFPDYRIEQMQFSRFLELNNIIVHYGKYKKTNKTYYPETISIRIETYLVRVNGTFEINKITLNKELQNKPTLLSRYNQVTLKQLFTDSE